MTMTIELPVFERFDAIKHIPLRVYNRVVMMNNLHEDAGANAAKAYAESFSEAERQQMYIMMAYIQSHGVEATKKFVTKNLVLVNDADAA